MKTLLSLLIGLALLPSALALEYVTLHSGKLTHDIASGSLVEVSGWGGALTSNNGYRTQEFKVTHAGGSTETIKLSQDQAVSGFKYFGATRVELPAFVCSVTFKITPATEINAAGPTNILVIPENAPGNYDLIVESSGDLLTWAPVFSQTIVNGAASNFFRARLVKK
jgi:hypothetical protein